MVVQWRGGEVCKEGKRNERKGYVREEKEEKKRGREKGKVGDMFGFEFAKRKKIDFVKKIVKISHFISSHTLQNMAFWF